MNPQCNSNIKNISNETITIITSNFREPQGISIALPGLSYSNLEDFLMESSGRPLPRFQAENSPVNGIDDEIGIGDNAIVSFPSGPYFLGLPLFFFTSVPVPGVGPKLETEPGAEPDSGATTLTGDADVAVAGATVGPGSGPGLGLSALGAALKLSGASSAFTVTPELILLFSSFPSIHRSTK